MSCYLETFTPLKHWEQVTWSLSSTESKNMENTLFEAVDVAQLVEYLTSMQETLGLILSSP